jgi:signal transduction histidine kinase
MKARRALCISRERGCCTAVETALVGAGLTVEHHDTLPPVTDGLALVVVDRAARVEAGDALRGITVPVVVVGDDLDDDGLIALMLEAPVSHLVEDPSDRNLTITSEKLATGDLFGLDKYVEAQAIHERIVGSDADKRRSMDEVCAWAESVGARRPVVHRIASVVDELLMNALHAGERAVVLRWANDEHTLAISVGDAFGNLSQRDVIAHVRRARDERGRPNPPSDGGAGLGLYLVLANVAALVVNVEPGRQTEVVCLFDLARGKPAAAGVRSLHVFAAS